MIKLFLNDMFGYTRIKFTFLIFTDIVYCSI